MLKCIDPNNRLNPDAFKLTVRVPTSRSPVVIKPLALIFYENLLPGSRLVNRLADLGYRSQVVPVATAVVAAARREKPIVIIADLALRNGDFCGIIRELRADPDTIHVPVLGYADPKNEKLVDAAVAAGANLVAAEAGILDQLPQLLDHVLAVD